MGGEGVVMVVYLRTKIIHFLRKLHPTEVTFAVMMLLRFLVI